MLYIVRYIQLSSDTSYDKIKHLVEIEDDIFAVFTINSTGEAYGLTVALGSIILMLMILLSF